MTEFILTGIFENLPDIEKAEILREVREWQPLTNGIQKRQDKGFDITKVEISGVSYFPRTKKILSVHTRTHYTSPEGKEDSYQINYMPDSACLLVAFRKAGQQASRRKPRVSDYHVVMVRQTRLGPNDAHSLEVPAGLLDGDCFNLKSWENERMGALREFLEETGSPESRAYMPVIKAKGIKPLGVMTLEPSQLRDQFAFFAEICVERERIRLIRDKVSGSRAGIAAEGESTRVEIMPLQQALDETLASRSLWNNAILMRFVAQKGMSCAPAAAFG
jgi:8-oxo-dGTP pyrophosphatase MutT (NUDIX family)